MRYLAIDLGARRTGIATGDDVTGIVMPVEVIELPIGDLLRNEIVKSIDRQGPDAIIIGLPLNMDGTEGDSARRVRAFGETIAARIEQPVHYHDERLTSFAAEEQLDGSGRTHKQKKELRDALAAATILRDFIHARAE